MKEAKQVFNTLADEYERVRPTYPDQLMDDIITFSNLTQEGNMIEIGCGTGQATGFFARNQYTIDCIEHGSNLANIARTKFSDCPNVTVYNQSFEEWKCDKDNYDLAISATAFHFIDPKIGYPKISQLLKPNGTLAFFWTVHVPEYSEIYSQIREVYKLYAPALDDSTYDPLKWIKGQQMTIDESSLFLPITVKKYSWDEEFNADRYIALLSTNSKHALLPNDQQKRLFNGVHDVILNFGDKINKKHLVALYLGKKK